MIERKDIQLFVGSPSDAEGIARTGHTAFDSAFTNENNKEEVHQYLKDSYSTTAIRSLIEQDGVSFFVAKENKRIIGFTQLVIRRPDSISTDKWLMMDRLYLLPEYIGQGIGRMLTERSIQYAKEIEAHWFWLMVLRPNKRAAQFYRKFGMEVFGESPGKFDADAAMDDWLKIKI